tara:strand:+ start:2034 stop:2642 length:609 start_codon:yes stop_codon:yes gene_type:complete
MKKWIMLATGVIVVLIIIYIGLIISKPFEDFVEEKSEERIKYDEAKIVYDSQMEVFNSATLILNDKDKSVEDRVLEIHLLFEVCNDIQQEITYNERDFLGKENCLLEGNEMVSEELILLGFENINGNRNPDITDLICSSGDYTPILWPSVVTSMLESGYKVHNNCYITLAVTKEQCHKYSYSKPRNFPQHIYDECESRIQSA